MCMKSLLSILNLIKRLWKYTFQVIQTTLACYSSCFRNIEQKCRAIHCCNTEPLYHCYSKVYTIKKLSTKMLIYYLYQSTNFERMLQHSFLNECYLCYKCYSFLFLMSNVTSVTAFLQFLTPHMKSTRD